MTSNITRRAALAGLSAFCGVAAGAGAVGEARRHHHDRSWLHAGRQCRSDRAPDRRAARRRSSVSQILVEPQARRRRHHRRRGSVARRARRQHACYLAAGGHAVSAAIYKPAALQAARGLLLDQHAVGLPVRVRHLSGSSGEEPGRFHRAWRRREEGKLAVRAPPATAPAMHLGARTVRRDRRHQGAARAVPRLAAGRGRSARQARRCLHGQHDGGRRDGEGWPRCARSASPGRRASSCFPMCRPSRRHGVAGYAVTSWLGLAGPGRHAARRCSARLNGEVVAILDGAGHRSTA